jgi:hypothetical protein
VYFTKLWLIGCGGQTLSTLLRPTDVGLIDERFKPFKVHEVIEIRRPKGTKKGRNSWTILRLKSYERMDNLVWADRGEELL